MISATIKFGFTVGRISGGQGGFVGSHGSLLRLVDRPLPMETRVPLLSNSAPYLKEFQPYEGWEPAIADNKCPSQK